MKYKLEIAAIIIIAMPVTLIACSTDSQPLADQSVKDAEIREEFIELKSTANDGTAEHKLDAFLFVYQNASILSEHAEVAFEYLVAAAEMGNVDAQYNLGYMLQSGTWIQKDEEAALPWLLLAAQNGKPNAQLWTGVNFLNKYYESSDEDLQQEYMLNATRWLRAASESGVLAADEFLVRALFINPETRSEGIDILKRAATAGNDSALETLRDLADFLEEMLVEGHPSAKDDLDDIQLFLDKNTAEGKDLGNG